LIAIAILQADSETGTRAKINLVPRVAIPVLGRELLESIYPRLARREKGQKVW